MIWRCGLWAFTSFLFPEVMVFIASSQWLEVRTFRKNLNSTLEAQGPERRQVRFIFDD